MEDLNITTEDKMWTIDITDGRVSTSCNNNNVNVTRTMVAALGYEIKNLREQVAHWKSLAEQDGPHRQQASDAYNHRVK